MLWSRAVMDVADARTVKTKASKKRPTSTHVWLDKNHVPNNQGQMLTAGAVSSL